MLSIGYFDKNSFLKQKGREKEVDS